jgi:hypothetical protein
MCRQPRADEACLDFVALTERDDAGQPFGPYDRAGPGPAVFPATSWSIGTTRFVDPGSGRTLLAAARALVLFVDGDAP